MTRELKNTAEQEILQDIFEKRILFEPKHKESSLTEIACSECQESIIFALQINGQAVSLGLSTILECLQIAEKEGIVPKIDEGREFGESPSWWLRVKNLHSGADLNYCNN
ncbi:MAG: hypothetical protein FWG63_11595 [Defluviitaleaceae bacterium]|nr:hypothetical protein [Defluviitaleaceae bacterium]